MIIVKNLAGELQEIDISSEDIKDFEEIYKQKYIKKKFHPFVTIKLLDSYNKNNIYNIYNIIINIHEILPWLENDEYNDYKWSEIYYNEHPKAINWIEQKIEEKLNDKKDDEKCYYQILSNSNAIHLIEKIINHIDINYYSMSLLSKNKNTKALELLENIIKSNRIAFENQDEMARYNFIISIISIMSVNSLYKNKKIIENDLKIVDIPSSIILSNYTASYIILKNINYIESLNDSEFYYLSLNENPQIVNLLITKYTQRINWEFFCQNESSIAIDFIEEKLDELFSNEIKYKNFNTIRMFINLLANKSAIYIIDKLKKRDIEIYKKLYIYSIWSNPSIFCPSTENEDIFL